MIFSIILALLGVVVSFAITVYGHGHWAIGMMGAVVSILYAVVQVRTQSLKT